MSGIEPHAELREMAANHMQMFVAWTQAVVHRRAGDADAVRRCSSAGIERGRVGVSTHEDWGSNTEADAGAYEYAVQDPRESHPQTGAEGRTPDGAAPVEGDRQPSAPPSTSICEFSDLPIEQCAHCLGHIAPEPQLAKVLAVDGGRARFDSRCPWCHQLILQGDPIWPTSDDSWICEGCAR